MIDVSDKLWAFFYNECIYESAAALISLHISEEGANKAMEFSKYEKKIEREMLYEDEPDDGEAMKAHNKEMRESESGMESWFVKEIEILP